MTGRVPDLPLRDIHLPDPVSAWPPAPGWWATAALVLAALAAVLLWRRGRGQRRLRRAALQELESLHARFTRDGDASRLCADLSALLRRSALLAVPRREVAGLTGERWLAWLDQGRPERPFQDGPGRALAEAPYRPDTGVDALALLALCRHWLQNMPGGEAQSR